MTMITVPCMVLSCVRFFASPWTVACQSPLSMEFSKQGYWSGLPFPSPEYLLNLRVKPASLVSPILAGRVFTALPPGKSKDYYSAIKERMKSSCF